uniref:Carboxylic ester hydrolase n=1 Tax=Ganoderma boninense TaxID=34458 RepID=A0A5K1JWF3_9APHY|nr:Carboxylic ester hydrolase (EC [Ganoderma boninense]
MFPSDLSGLLPLALSFAPFSALWGPGVVSPTIRLDQAIVYGSTNGSVTSFLNIPFAEAPIGNLRLRLPKPIDGYNGTIDATKLGPQCIQQMLLYREDMPAEMLHDVLSAVNLSPIEPRPQSEDCLNLNVLVPAGTTADEKLPVVVFIYGGGFSVGDNAQFNGEVIVQRSVEMGQPVIFAAMNYRLHAFGFLGGQEVKEAGIGNLGLHDQREGLRWVKKYIASFGGDPDKVTIWGPSAGGLSVGSQLVANGGNNEGLFHAAVLSCGTLLSTGDTSNQQRFFDSVVADTGCADAGDKLECLRRVPAESLAAAAATIPNIFDYTGLSSPQWFPHADGVFLKVPVREEVLSGRIAGVPFIAGQSPFAPALPSSDTESANRWFFGRRNDLRHWSMEHHHRRGIPRLHARLLLPRIVQRGSRALLALYPNDPAQGSPFGTGDENQLAPMFKRVSAFQGDFLFQAQQRSLLALRSGKQPAWSYSAGAALKASDTTDEHLCGSRPYQRHGGDLQLFGEGAELIDYLIQFAATLDPNGGSNRTIPWPRYEPARRQTLLVQEGEEPLAVGRDDAREEAMEFVAALSLKYPL